MRIEKMKKQIYLVCGVPGSGKSWCCEQLADKFHYVHHDLFIGQSGPVYLNAIFSAIQSATKPLLIEAPFSISQTLEPLQNAGHDVVPLVIVEKEPVLRDRYWNREKKEIPKGHLTRMQTYFNRAKEKGWFFGTSNEVLKYLQDIK